MGPVVLVSFQVDREALGLRLLHQLLLERGHDSRLLFLDEPFDPAAPALEAWAPAFVGVSLVSLEHRKAARFTAWARARWPRRPVVWGGVHPTLAPHACLDHADGVCVGEGEGPLLALASGADLEAIPGMGFRRGGDTVLNPPSPPMDLGDLPRMAHCPPRSWEVEGGALVPVHRGRYRQKARYGGAVMSLLTSRGCPFACTYCGNNALAPHRGGRGVRFRPVERVVEEAARAVADHPEVVLFNLQDDCFLARSTAELEQFAAAWGSRVGRPFVARTIPTFVDPERIRICQGAGLSWISLGLQSGSERVCRDVYRRGSGPQDFLRAARMVEEAGLAAFYDIILDNPFETDQDRLQTVRVLMDTPKPFYPQLFSLSLYPGTELRERARQEGILDEEAYLDKDYLRFADTPLNALIRAACFAPARRVEPVLEAWGTGRFSRLLAGLTLETALVWEPRAYLGVLGRAQGGDLPRALRLARVLARQGWERVV